MNGAPGSSQRERLFAVGVLATWLAVVLFVGLHHEPWRDEADAWLVVRDRSLRELFALTPYMGTPALWYLLLEPLVSLGAPYRSMGVLAGALAFGAAALVVVRSPFPRPVRLLLPFGLLLSYEYAVIARSYSVSLALLFAVAGLDRQRRDRPLLYHGCLGLLFHTNSHSIVLASVLLALSWLERLTSRRPPPLVGPVLATLLALLALVQILPQPADAQVLLLPEVTALEVLADSWRAPLLGGREGGLWTALAFGFLPLALWQLRRDRRALAFALGSWLGLWGLFLGVYPGALRHWGFLFLALVVALWMQRDAAAAADPAESPPPSRRPLRREPVMAVFALLLLVNAAGAGEAWWRDLRHPFSMSEALAQYLRAQGLAETPLAGHRAPNVSAILPYLPRELLYYPGIDALGSHMRWDRRYVEGLLTPLPVVLRRTARFYPSGDALLVLSYPSEHPALQLVHEAADPHTIVPDERYYVYRLRRSRPRGQGGDAP